MAFDATLDTLYRWADKVLRLDDTPPRWPRRLPGASSPAFRHSSSPSTSWPSWWRWYFAFNKLLVLAGVCINLPWMIGAVVPRRPTAIAGAVLGVPVAR